MKKAKNVVSARDPLPPFCLDGLAHHYQQVSENHITAATLGQLGPFQGALSPNRSPRFICIKCGKVIKVD